MTGNFTVTFSADHVLMVATDIRAGSRIIIKGGLIVGVLPPESSTPVVAHLEHEPERPVAAGPTPPWGAPEPLKVTQRAKGSTRFGHKKSRSKKPVQFWKDKKQVLVEKAAAPRNAAALFNGPVPPYAIIYDFLRKTGAMTVSAICEKYSCPIGSTHRQVLSWRLRHMAHKNWIKNIAEPGQRALIYSAVEGAKVPLALAPSPPQEPEVARDSV